MLLIHNFFDFCFDNGTHNVYSLICEYISVKFSKNLMSICCELKGSKGLSFGQKYKWERFYEVAGI